MLTPLNIPVIGYRKAFDNRRLKYIKYLLLWIISMFNVLIALCKGNTITLETKKRPEGLDWWCTRWDSNLHPTYRPNSRSIH